MKKDLFLLLPLLLIIGCGGKQHKDNQSYNQKNDSKTKTDTEYSNPGGDSPLSPHKLPDRSINTPPGWTALHDASVDGDVEKMQSLIKKGADINEVTHDGYNCTPLYLAAMYGHKSAVEFLLVKGAKNNIPDSDGRTPLLAASAGMHKEGVVELLLASGANVNAVDKEGLTAIHWAARQHGTARVIDILVEHGGNINARDYKGYSPLHHAAENINKDAMKGLLEDIHTDINALNKNGSTALHIASYHGWIDIVQLLLDNGINKNIKNIFGVTALDLALKYHHRNIAELLKKHW